MSRKRSALVRLLKRDEQYMRTSRMFFRNDNGYKPAGLAAPGNLPEMASRLRNESRSAPSLPQAPSAFVLVIPEPWRQVNPRLRQPRESAVRKRAHDSACVMTPTHSPSATCWSCRWEESLWAAVNGRWPNLLPPSRGWANCDPRGPTEIKVDRCCLNGL